MAHFAEIDENNIVLRVIVAEQEFIDSGELGDPSKWIQTSYNTRAGVHQLGGIPFRKNYAVPGMIWDASRDAFYVPQPSPRFTLNEETCTWEFPPKPEGDTRRYMYNFRLDKWELLVNPRPYESWSWNEETYYWEPPIPYPEPILANESPRYIWDEDNMQWVLNVQ
jgi:hypothetical protein